MSTPLKKSYQTLRWLEDMDPQAADTASDLESLEQDVFHILIQVQGTNLDDPNRGLGVIDLLGGNQTNILSLPARADAQLEDDPRIDSSSTTVSQNPDGTWLIAITVEVDGSVVDLNYQLGPNGLTIAPGGA